jgi:putative toxin-antitoxin system antitoxin component (TIGR02293 family)
MPTQNLDTAKSSLTQGKRAKPTVAIGSVTERTLGEGITVTIIRGDAKPSIFNEVKRGLWEQLQHVRKGLPSVFVVEMSDALQMPRATFLEHLQLPRSTIESRIKGKRALSSTEGDAVLRAAKAFTRAQEVLEDRAAATAWLKRPIRSLGGVTPMSLMDTDSGYALVMDTLGKIEHGVVA